MLVQYLVSLGATNFGKSKAKSVMAINSPKVKKERIFRVHFISGKLLSAFCPKMHVTTKLQAQPCS